MNVLLVDDSKTMRNIQKAALATMGPVTTVEAGDGVEGIKAIAAAGPTAPFDLMLVDWNMPNMTGLEMVAKVRAAGIKTPIIMVTTEGERDRVWKPSGPGPTTTASSRSSPRTWSPRSRPRSPSSGPPETRSV